jgi:hypothetical protein
VIDRVVAAVPEPGAGSLTRSREFTTGVVHEGADRAVREA